MCIKFCLRQNQGTPTSGKSQALSYYLARGGGLAFLHLNPRSIEDDALDSTRTPALLTGARGDNFRSLLPESAKVKCAADVGFFIDGSFAKTSEIK